MTNTEDRLIRLAQVTVLAVVIALLANATVVGYKAFQNYTSAKAEVDEMNDGLSAFEGGERVAALQALRAADACLSYPDGWPPTFTGSGLKVTDVELTGGMSSSGAQRVTEFQAKVRAYTYNISGISTEEIAVWTEDYRIHKDCGSLDS